MRTARSITPVLLPGAFVALLVWGCSSSMSPSAAPQPTPTPTPAPSPTPTPAPGPTPAPTPSPTPAPAPPPATFANMAGRWSGTIESPGQATRAVSVEIFQAADCVDGAWGTAPSEWAGAISGFAAADSFSGVMSFEGSGAGGRCTATGTASGPVTGNVMTLNWSGPALTGTCAGVLPRSAVVHLQR